MSKYGCSTQKLQEFRYLGVGRFAGYQLFIDSLDPRAHSA
jgi:hypothetical protein